MHQSTADSAEKLTKLKHIFGSFYIASKTTALKKEFPQLSDEALSERLFENLASLSPYVMQEFQHNSTLEAQSETASISTGALPNDIEHFRHISLPSHTSDLLEGISGPHMNENLIQINPNF